METVWSCPELSLLSIRHCSVTRCLPTPSLLADLAQVCLRLKACPKLTTLHLAGEPFERPQGPGFPLAADLFGSGRITSLYLTASELSRARATVFTLPQGSFPDLLEIGFDVNTWGWNDRLDDTAETGAASLLHTLAERLPRPEIVQRCMLRMDAAVIQHHPLLMEKLLGKGEDHGGSSSLRRLQ
ncbi:hypothetical protein OH77DRAFT_1427695 [Trametes cingulata]|nr:hypothetical protein OH77DRAFT_1427695 [Trametes cingulata]